MAQPTRRSFVSALVAGGAAASLVRAQAPEPVVAVAAPRRATDLVELGRTGVKVSRVGLGTGVRGWNQESNATRMGAEVYVPLMRPAYDRGVTFFDVADLYGTHGYLRSFLADVPREKITIQSKIWFMAHGVPEKLTSARAAVERFLREIGTDHIDSLLLHCTSDGDWPTKLEPHLAELEECRERGLIRSHGTSCHSLPALQASAATPWVQVQMARINHRGDKMDGTPDEIAGLLKQMRADGKGVVGMKLYGEGSFEDAALREASLRWVVDQGCVDTMVIGLESIQHIDETIATLDRAYAAAPVAT